MSVDTLLHGLEKVKKTGHDKWQACCPAHDDKGPSLAIKELDDGRVLIHCFAGCSAIEILDSINLDWSALIPTKAIDHHVQKVRRAWIAIDVLNALAMEILIAWNFTKAMAIGTSLSTKDSERLLLCASRMQSGLDAINGR